MIHDIIKHQKCQFVHKSNSIRHFGRLSITVKNKLTDMPVSFAVVSIYYLIIKGLYGEQGESHLFVRHITDENGKIPVVELPIIDRATSPYSQYYMTINHFRYYPVHAMNIQMYPNVTTEYNILLTPTTERNPDYEFLITPELIR